LLLCAKGVARKDSEDELAKWGPLLIGVRVDRPGQTDWDYHTAGASTGIRSADGKIKRTASTGEFETLLSRRQYLYDASFLVALRGLPEMVIACAAALADPVWPVFLGRKCCVPGEPVFGGTGTFDSLSDALASVAWRPRIIAIDGRFRNSTRTLDTYIEHPPGSPPPAHARLVHDVPRRFGYYSHGARWVAPGKVTVRVGEPAQNPPGESFAPRVDSTSAQWKAARARRVDLDNHLCVFCKAPADDVHHVDYANVGHETNADLRSLCKTCHDACTILEYGHGMHRQRIDPSDREQRAAILCQINRLLTERRLGRRGELLESAREDAAVSSGKEGL
jgi:CRISPR-associated protein Cas5/CasD subtype I-E